MKRVNDLSVSRTTHGELAGIAAHIISIIKQYLSQYEFLLAIILIIGNSLEKFKQSMSAIRINKLIKENTRLDKIRDNAFITFRNMVIAFVKTNIPVEKKAYDVLWPVIDRLGTTLYNDGYLEQSSKLETLFQEMSKPDKVEAMEVLKITNRLDDLKIAEENFKKSYNERIELETSTDYPTIRDARKELMPLVNDLLSTLRLLAMIQPAGSDLKWVDLINEQIDMVMTQVAARKTRKENKEGDNAGENLEDERTVENPVDSIT